MKILIFVSLMFLSSCSFLGITKSYYATDLKVGMSQQQLIEMFDEPYQTEFLNGNYYSAYEIDDNYYILQFKDGKLSEWSIDTRKHRMEEERRRRNAAIWLGVGAALNNTNQQNQQYQQPITQPTVVVPNNNRFTCTTNGNTTNCR